MSIYLQNKDIVLHSQSIARQFHKMATDMKSKEVKILVDGALSTGMLIGTLLPLIITIPVDLHNRGFYKMSLAASTVGGWLACRFRSLFD